VRGLLENQLATLAWGDSLRRSPLRVKFTRLLLAAGFSPALARGALAKLPDDYSDEEGGKWLAEVLARNVPVVEPEDNLVAQGGVYAIVGPTARVRRQRRPNSRRAAWCVSAPTTWRW
jgi:flagellar biosynthesis protein FlhF